MGQLLDLALQTAQAPVSAMTAGEEAELRAWLDRIEEHDPAIRAHLLKQCREDAGHRAYFLKYAHGLFQKHR